ncbi:hypothetical protein J6590_079322 [Homalodisca vitripennis]|nr:hypothetical protein J6590_079322 [Homalodisca vitripennis]
MYSILVLDKIDRISILLQEQFEVMFEVKSAGNKQLIGRRGAARGSEPSTQPFLTWIVWTVAISGFMATRGDVQRQGRLLMKCAELNCRSALYLAPSTRCYITSADTPRVLQDRTPV